MRIRVLVVTAGETRWNAGDVADVDQVEAVAMFARGEAEPVAAKPSKRAESRPSGAKKETR